MSLTFTSFATAQWRPRVLQVFVTFIIFNITLFNFNIMVFISILIVFKSISISLSISCFQEEMDSLSPSSMLR